jgi:hypothetical protein
MMRVGLQAAAVANGAASLANIFCPFVPRKLVPPSLLAKATTFVDGLGKPSNVAANKSVQKHVAGGDEGGEAKRGGELRDFEKVLQTHDPEATYAGLMRVCNEENGTAIWVSEESAKDIESGRGDARLEDVEEMRSAALEIAKLRAEVEQLHVQDAARKPPAPPELDASDAQEVAKLRAEVEQLRKRPAASEQDATEVAKLRAENDELKKRPASLPAKKAKVQQNEIASLKERLRSASSAASLSSAAAPEVKLKGTLQKLTKGVLGCNRVWAARRVALHASGLLLWEDRVANKRGWMQTVEDGAEPHAEDACRIDVTTNGRLVSFRTTRPEEREEWVEALNAGGGRDSIVNPMVVEGWGGGGGGGDKI